jgi:molybdate transport system substrate-binding protein
MTKTNIAIIGFVFSAMGTVTLASAAEIKVLSARSLNLAMTELIPIFQKSSGNTVTIDYGTAGATVSRIQKGELTDVVIASESQLEMLEGQGKVLQGSRVNIAGVSLGVAVRKGAPQPDVSSVEAFKRTLLSARSIGYIDPARGALSGIYIAGLLERLGIAQDLKPKIKLVGGGEGLPEDPFQEVEKGDIELQIGQISEIVMSHGVDLVGPLPTEIQNVSWLAAGVIKTSKLLEAANALIKFMSSPAAAAIVRSKGFEPGQ